MVAAILVCAGPMGGAMAAARVVRPVVPVVQCIDGSLVVSILGADSVDGVAGVSTEDGLYYVSDVDDLDPGVTYVAVIGDGVSADVAPPVAGDDYTFSTDDQGTQGLWTFHRVDYCDVPAPTATSVYRFWSPRLTTHFFTIDQGERDYLETPALAATWNYEGAKYSAFVTRADGTVPLYRFFSARLGGHFYTTDKVEADSVAKNYDDATWRFEGVAYYVYPRDFSDADVPTVGVARFWSPVYQHHFYTADAAESAAVRMRYPSIWTYEGIDFRVPAP